MKRRSRTKRAIAARLGWQRRKRREAWQRVQWERREALRRPCKITVGITAPSLDMLLAILNAPAEDDRGGYQGA